LHGGYAGEVGLAHLAEQGAVLVVEVAERTLDHLSTSSSGVHLGRMKDEG
jgi:hypothetical protein